MDPDAYLCQLADIFNGITVNPPSFSAIVAIVLAGVLLLASGFASASEIAFFSLSPSDLNEIDERNHPSDEKISSLLGDSESLLATVLITNNFVNVTIIMLCNFFFMRKKQCHNYASSSDGGSLIVNFTFKIRRLSISSTSKS